MWPTGEMKMKGGSRVEEKLSEVHPRGAGFTQTDTIYPQPFYFYPHMHPFYRCPAGSPRTQTGERGHDGERENASLAG